MEIVIGHAQEEFRGFFPGDLVSYGHDIGYVHVISREGMLGT